MKNLRTILMVILICLFATTFITPTQEAYALTKEDLNLSYGDDGIQYGADSAWEKNKNTGQEGAWQVIFTEYKGVIIGISGIATFTMIVFFILNFIKLAQAGENPQKKTAAINGLLFTGLATAGCGSVTLFVAIFANLFKGAEDTMASTGSTTS